MGILVRGVVMIKLVKFSLAPVVALMVFWVQGVFSHSSVDQSNEEINQGQEKQNVGGSNTIAFNMPIGQEFTPTQSILTGVDAYLTSVNPQLGDAENITVKIRKGTINSPVLATGFQLVRSFDQKGRPIVGFVHINLQPALTVDTEAVYVLEVVAPHFGEVAAAPTR